MLHHTALTGNECVINVISLSILWCVFFFDKNLKGKSAQMTSNSSHADCFVLVVFRCLVSCCGQFVSKQLSIYTLSRHKATLAFI